MDKILLGKKAVVTGGGRGIGKAITEQFLKEGASVAIFGTNRARGEEAVKELSSHLAPEQTVNFYQVDLAKADQIEPALQKILQEWGAVDILVNNAGITKDNLLMKSSEEDWDLVLDTNLRSVYHMCRLLIRSMLKARKGKIINISSVVGLIGNAGQTNYAASKAGMIGFTKSLAKEVASRNICVNCIAPGFIQTEMTDVLSDSQKEGLLGQIPMQRLGTSQEIAYAALYLASHLSDYVTGQVLTVDGGMVM